MRAGLGILECLPTGGAAAAGADIISIDLITWYIGHPQFSIRESGILRQRQRSAIAGPQHPICRELSNGRLRRGSKLLKKPTRLMNDRNCWSVLGFGGHGRTSAARCLANSKKHERTDGKIGKRGLLLPCETLVCSALHMVVRMLPSCTRRASLNTNNGGMSSSPKVTGSVLCEDGIRERSM